MKPKKLRKQMAKAMSKAIPKVWAMLCGLKRKTRWKLAWLLIKGDPDIRKAAEQ